MEICEAVLALDLIDPQLDLAEGLILILDKIRQVDLNNATLKRVIGIPCTATIRNAKAKELVTNLRRPCDLFTRVFPTFLTSKIDGALMSYHSKRRSEQHAPMRNKRGWAYPFV